MGLWDQITGNFRSPNTRDKACDLGLQSHGILNSNHMWFWHRNFGNPIYNPCDLYPNPMGYWDQITGNFRSPNTRDKACDLGLKSHGIWVNPNHRDYLNQNTMVLFKKAWDFKIPGLFFRCAKDVGRVLLLAHTHAMRAFHCNKSK